MSTLNEVGNPLEYVCHLSHHPEPLLHQSQQLLVLLCCGTFLKIFCISRVNFVTEMFHLICGDVVIILESFLITFHSNGVFLPAVPPIGYSHSALTHFTSLKENVRIKFRVFLLNFCFLPEPRSCH